MDWECEKGNDQEMLYKTNCKDLFVSQLGECGHKPRVRVGVKDSSTLCRINETILGFIKQ